MKIYLAGWALAVFLAGTAWGATVAYREELSGGVKTTVPVIQGSKGEADAAVNASLAALVEDQVRSLKDGDPRELIVEGRAELLEGPLWSFSFEGMVDFEGAAHPSSTKKGATFDAASGRALSLEELFLPGTDWARAVNAQLALAIDRQVAEDDLMLFDEGAPDVAEYAEQFFLRPGALVIFWTDTQFSPHACGQPEFILPRGAFESLLRPEYASW